MAAPGPRDVSEEPVRYATGEIVLSETDLMSQAFGTPWGHTRSYVHRQVHHKTLQPIAEDRGQGWNWQVQQWPYLVRHMGGQGQLLGYVVQGQANAQLWFDMDNGQLAARFGSKQTLAFDRESWTFVLTDPSGNATNFAAFDQIESGMFLCHTDPGGVVTKVVAFASSGQRIGEVQRTEGNVTESLLYAYFTMPTWDDVPRLSSVTLRRKEGAGAWATVSSAAYGYYGNGMSPGDEHGNMGDLKTVLVYGAGGGTHCTTYYRYYRDGGSSSSSGAAGSSSSSSGGGAGGGHLLKYVVSGESYERLLAAACGAPPGQVPFEPAPAVYKHASLTMLVGSVKEAATACGEGPPAAAAGRTEP